MLFFSFFDTSDLIVNDNKDNKLFNSDFGLLKFSIDKV